MASAFRGLAGRNRGSLRRGDANGVQRRRKEEVIDVGELRDSLAAVHSVSVRERAELALREGSIALDEGEAALWAHALGRNDVWTLCGPDRASLRCGVRLGYRERLVSLEELLKRVGHRSSGLRPAYTQKWHDRVVGQIRLEELSTSATTPLVQADRS